MPLYTQGGPETIFVLIFDGFGAPFGRPFCALGTHFGALGAHFGALGAHFGDILVPLGSLGA